jgi:RNA polymerase sigma-70 factor (ECF subfamily)
VTPAPDAEAAWLAAMARRDQAALETLVEAWTPRFFAFSLRLLRDRAWAEEAVQDAFLKVWSHAARYDPRLGKASSWMFSVLHRTCLDRLRRERARGSKVTVASAQAPEAAAAEALDPVLGLRLEQALRALNPDQRRAFELSYFQGYTHEEIARDLGLPLGTVKTRLRDGLLKLKKAFQAGPSKPGPDALSLQKGSRS